MLLFYVRFATSQVFHINPQNTKTRNWIGTCLESLLHVQPQDVLRKYSRLMIFKYSKVVSLEFSICRNTIMLPPTFLKQQIFWSNVLFPLKYTYLLFNELWKSRRYTCLEMSSLFKRMYVYNQLLCTFRWTTVCILRRALNYCCLPPWQNRLFLNPFPFPLLKKFGIPLYF